MSYGIHYFASVEKHRNEMAQVALAGLRRCTI